MKCEHCGFISSKEFYKCPYCGKIQPVESNILDNDIKIGTLFQIRLRTLIIVIITNLMLAAIFVDIITMFAYCVSYWSFIVLGGAYLVLSLRASKSPLIVTAEKIDIFILVILVLGTWAIKFKIGGIPAGRFMPTIVIPTATVLGSALSFSLLFTKRNHKFRPLWTEVLLFLHLALMVTIFVLYLVAKHGDNQVLRDYFLFDGILGGYQMVVIYLGLAASVLYIINYNIVMFGHILKEVKIRYGGEERN